MCGGKKVHCNQNIHFHLNQSYAPQPFGAIVWIQMVLMDMGHDYVCPVYIRNVLCIFVTLGRKAACSHSEMPISVDETPKELPCLFWHNNCCKMGSCLWLIGCVFTDSHVWSMEFNRLTPEYFLCN